MVLSGMHRKGIGQWRRRSYDPGVGSARIYRCHTFGHGPDKPGCEGNLGFQVDTNKGKGRFEVGCISAGIPCNVRESSRKDVHAKAQREEERKEERGSMIMKGTPDSRLMIHNGCGLLFCFDTVSGDLDPLRASRRRHKADGYRDSQLLNHSTTNQSTLDS